MNIISQIILREIILSSRDFGGWITQFLFFVLIVTLIPLGIGVNQQLLQEVATGFTWVGLLISIVMMLPNIFQKDWESGVLEQDVLGSFNIELLILSKALSFWLISCFPLVLTAPVLMGMLFVPMEQAMWAILPLLVGSFGLCLLGSIAAAVVTGNTKSSGIMMLLLLPLFIPFLIFGSMASMKAMHGDLGSPEWWMICGLSLLLLPISLVLTPVLIRKAIA